MKNKIPEPKIKRGVKRDHLTQQTMKSFVSTMYTPIPENEESVIKKPKIENSGSDMEISSDDDVQIIETGNINDSNNCLPKIEELHSPEKKCNASNLEPLYYQTTSRNIQPPKLVFSSNLFINNNASCNSTCDSLSSNNILNVPNNLPPTHLQDNQILHKSNNTSTNSINNVIDLENNLSHVQPKNISQTNEKSYTDIFNEVTQIVDSSSEDEQNEIKPQNVLPAIRKQNDLKRLSAEKRLPTSQNNEVPSSKSNMNSLFGDDSDDESKIPLVDVKKKSLGIRPGLSLNVTSKTDKKSLESLSTIKNKTEDQNKQKKFELSNLVVSLLNPYYKNNFKTKELFKFMARKIVHKLLESMSNPGK